MLNNTENSGQQLVALFCLASLSLNFKFQKLTKGKTVVIGVFLQIQNKYAKKCPVIRKVQPLSNTPN